MGVLVKKALFLLGQAFLLQRSLGWRCRTSIEYNRTREICCQGHVQKRTHKLSRCCGEVAFETHTHQCCVNTMVYEKASEIFCLGKVFSGTYATRRCCGVDSYDPRTGICCRGKVFPRGMFENQLANCSVRTTQTRTVVVMAGMY